jgi:ankyrin repeat protein
LKKGASLQFSSFARINPLDFALHKKNMDAAGLLLDSIDINKVAFANNETWHTDAIRRREDLIPLLLDRGVDFKTIRRLKVGPPAVPHVTELDVDPLGLAVLYNKTNAAKLLIEAGADVNQVYHGGRTLLMWAVARENKDIVRSLIDYGGWKSLDKQNAQGKTARDIAHEKGFSEIEKLLKSPKIT